MKLRSYGYPSAVTEESIDVTSFSTLPASDELYRFRSVESLIGEFKELYYQTIYLANPYELNDLSETITQVEWQGDHIVWSQFINYYWHSLRFKEIGIQNVVLPGYHMFDNNPLTDPAFQTYIAELNGSYETIKTDSIAKLIDKDVNQSYDVTTVLDRLTPSRVLRDTAYGFVQQFMEAISKLPYTLGRVAAFSKDFTNPYMWAMYADNNQGVCLIYDRTILDKIKAQNIYAYDLEIADVNYTKSKPKLEWFKTLPMMTKAAYRYLFTDDEGNRSPLAFDLDDRDAVSAAFERQRKISRNALLTKPKHWESEKEVRMFQMTREINETATIVYPIDALKGVVFGARVTDEGAKSIMDVLRAKHVANPLRNDFQLCRARLKPDGSLDRVPDTALSDWLQQSNRA